MSSKIQYLVIHCTATPEGREVTGDDIRRMHLSPVSQGGRGWKQVGYTDLFKLNGTVERLVQNNENDIVDSWEITNGATGINSVSRHIVYAGGTDKALKPKDTRTDAQKAALKKYVIDFVKRFPNVKVAGHNQFANKACPSFDVQKWCREIGVPEKNIYTGGGSAPVSNTSTPVTKAPVQSSGTNLKANTQPDNYKAPLADSSAGGKIIPLIGLLLAVVASYFYIR